MPVFTSSIEVTADYPTIKPSLNLNFARSRSLDPRITFTRASTATYIGRDGLVKYAGVDEARFDHDPETLESLGLLIEESRTNNALYSDDFNNNTWLKQTGHGLTSNTTIAPDGTQTADTFNRGALNQFIYQSIGITGTHTLSVWVKTPSGAGNLDFVMQHYNTTNGGLGITTFTATEEWQRFSIQASPTVGGGWYPCIPITLSQDYHVWGAQIEAGSFPTSYIPTSGSAVTRAADRARITGTSFSNFFNTTEGTLVVQGRTSAGNSLNYTNQPIISIHAGSATNRMIVFDRDPGTLEWNVVDGSSANGSGLLLDETTSYSGAADYIMCGTYKNGAPTRAVANGLGADGTTIESSGKNDTVNIFNQMDIGNEFGTRHCSSPIKQVRYYPLSLSDAEIKTLVQ